MLRSMGPQRVRHEWAIEQQPPYEKSESINHSVMSYSL